tara:strand:+ start:360 stop:641 length:282 start_codon:yes stop_codon:yes gene_type:complete
MAGLGGSSRDDARPFIYPNMKGMPEREKAMRATAEKGKAKAAQKKALDFAKQSEVAFQEGNYALGSVLRAKSKDRKLQELTHTFRYSRYKTNK